jgi:hypothetical protein
MVRGIRRYQYAFPREVRLWCGACGDYTPAIKDPQWRSRWPAPNICTRCSKFFMDVTLRDSLKVPKGKIVAETVEWEYVCEACGSRAEALTKEPQDCPKCGAAL